jgi:hypothetical protein
MKEVNCPGEGQLGEEWTAEQGERGVVNTWLKFYAISAFHSYFSIYHDVRLVNPKVNLIA